MLRNKRKVGSLALIILGALAYGAVRAENTVFNDMSPEMQAKLAKMAPEQRQMLLSYTPELRQKVMALTPEISATVQRMYASHTRHSDTLTFRQMMQEVLADYQSVVAGIAVDNAAQTADSARRLANHRIPRGGLLPYFPLEKINSDTLAVLVSMNDAVEGSALRLAAAADKGNMAEAASHLSAIAGGCVACHQVFRGQPGVSPLLLPQAGK